MCWTVSVCVSVLPVRQKLKLWFSANRGHNGVRSCVDCLQTDVSLVLTLIDGTSGKQADEKHNYDMDAMEGIYFLFKVGHIELC